MKLLNKFTGERAEVRGHITINAAGIWGQRIASMAGAKINMFPAKGALLIFGHRVNNMVINRCRKPANADILVPDDAVCVIGTTSDRVPVETVDDMRVTDEEVQVLLTEGEKLAPALATTRILRAYAGVRPLVASDDDPSGRSISRGIVCLDHESRDGIGGFITITGGKMMTYRLMAEEVTNMACRKLGRDVACTTAETPLPGSEPQQEKSIEKTISFASRAAQGRHGALADEIKADRPSDRALVCECEGVSVGEIRYASQQLHVHNLMNLRRRTRTGMGTCQGKLCACRAANLLGKYNHDAKLAQADLAKFLGERWKGVKPIAWGSALREAQLTATVYQRLCGLDKAVARKEGEQ